MTTAKHQLEVEPDEDGEQPGPSDARRIGFTIAAIVMFLSSTAALYNWLLKSSQSPPSFWESKVFGILGLAREVFPPGEWVAYFLFAGSLTALLPATLLSFAKHNSPTNFRSEHWIWSTLLFWGCGIWILHLVGADRDEAVAWTTPWQVRLLPPNPDSPPVADWLALALPAASCAIFAAFRARHPRATNVAHAMERARAARLRLTIGVASLCCWVQCMVYAAAAAPMARHWLSKGPIGTTLTEEPVLFPETAELSVLEKTRIAEIHAAYLSSSRHLITCISPATFALVVYVLLRVARNRHPLRSCDIWPAAVSTVSFLALAFTFDRGTRDLLAYRSYPQAPEPTILSFGLTDPIPVALLPLCALLIFVAWWDWRSATRLLRKDDPTTP